MIRYLGCGLFWLISFFDRWHFPDIKIYSLEGNLGTATVNGLAKRF